MKSHLPTWMAAVLMAGPACALDVSSGIAQPQSISPTPAALEYESYYGDDAATSEVSPSDSVVEPAPIYPENASPVPAPAVKQTSSCGCSTAAAPSCAAPSCCDNAYDCCDSCGCGNACGCGSSCSLFDCCIGEPFSLAESICGPCRSFDFGGWTQLGYHSNNTRLSTTFADGAAFNDVPDQLNLHQQWMWFERVADGSCGLDWGFRFDIMYGTDAQKTQSFGNDSPVWDASNGFDHGEYGWAMPQAYIELAQGDWSIIAGHFYTLVGYEVVTAPDNFFYSHSLTMFNSEPFTHTGALATYTGIDGVDIFAGWTLGWDTGFDQALGGSSWLGGFSTNLTEDIAMTYISTAGNFGLRSGGEDGYSHSLVFDVTMSDNLNYVLQSDLVSYDENGANVGSGDQVGINQYLFYTVNDCLAVGARAEWWKSDGQSFYEITYGMNYRPHANVVLRPEVRHDWTPTDGGYGNGTDDATTFGIDAILTF